MKKIMISLLMVAATLNAMAAITIEGQAKLKATADNSKYCELTIAQSEDFADGLNSGWYAELNTEGKEVLMYVLYKGVKYQVFCANEKTWKDAQLVIENVSSADHNYTLTASEIAGSKVMSVMIDGVSNDITATLNVAFACAKGQKLDDPTKSYVGPKVAGPEFCFAEELLKVNGYAGKSLEIWKDGAASAMETVSALPATYQKDFSAEAAGKYIIKFDGVTNVFTDGLVHEYVIDVKPATTKKP